MSPCCTSARTIPFLRLEKGLCLLVHEPNKLYDFDWNAVMLLESCLTWGHQAIMLINRIEIRWNDRLSAAQ